MKSNDIRTPPVAEPLESSAVQAAIHHRYPLPWLDRCGVVETDSENSILTMVL